MLDPPTDLSTMIENSLLSSFKYIPRLIWKLNKLDIYIWSPKSDQMDNYDG